LITGIAGSNICIAVGPSAEVAARRTMTRFAKVFSMTSYFSQRADVAIGLTLSV
jgi:hypothetical protein